MAGLGTLDGRLGSELAHHENGRDRISAPHLSLHLLADWHPRAGPGAVGHESALSHSSTLLARALGVGHLQHVHLARHDHFGGAVFVEWSVGHLGLHHAHFLCRHWRLGLSKPTVQARLGRCCSGCFGRGVAALARTVQPQWQTCGRDVGLGRCQHVGTGHTVAAPNPHSFAHPHLVFLDDRHDGRGHGHFVVHL